MTPVWTKSPGLSDQSPETPAREHLNGTIEALCPSPTWGRAGFHQEEDYTGLTPV